MSTDCRHFSIFDPLRILAVVLLAGLWVYPALAQETIHPGLSGQPLLDAIDADFSPTNWYSYDDARDTLFLRIDADGDQLRGVYTGYSITLTAGEDPSRDAFNKGINTEHTWPQSMGADEIPARSDMHHLFPVKDNVNSSRSNCPYDEVPDAETDTWYWTDQSSSAIPSTSIDAWSEKDNDNPAPSYDCRFEPREDHKGDAARAVFYFAAVYPERTNSDFFEVQKEVLLDWHYTDLPTEAERDRSDRIAIDQGTSNPFVVDTTLIRRAFFSRSSSAEIQTALYRFEGNDECPTMDNGVESSPVGAQFSDFVRVGVECNNAAGVFNLRGWPSTRRDNSYVTFSVTPESGNSIRFSESTQLSFMTRRSGTGPPSGEVMFGTGGTGEFISLGTWELSDTDEHVIEVTFPDTSVSDVLEVRFLGWGSTSSVGTLRFDDVQLEYIHETSVAAERSREELPASFELISAYPNPFNPTTTVTLRVNQADEIAIELFDVIGRRVKVFGATYFPAGEHGVRVDAAGLPSGAYWIRATGTRHSAGRMVLLQK